MQFLAFSILKKVFLDYTFPSSNQPISHSFFIERCLQSGPHLLSSVSFASASLLFTPTRLLSHLLLCHQWLHTAKSVVMSLPTPHRNPQTLSTQVNAFLIMKHFIMNTHLLFFLPLIQSFHVQVPQGSALGHSVVFPHLLLPLSFLFGKEPLHAPGFSSQIPFLSPCTSSLSTSCL